MKTSSPAATHALPHADDELMSVTEVATLVRVPMATVRYWRHLGTGPHGFRVGRSVRYWRGRYRDELGREHTRHFERKVDAQQWLDQIAAAIVTGTYADPRAGQITFAAFFGKWSARQVWAPGT